jgi:signal transduction histidine kinase
MAESNGESSFTKPTGCSMPSCTAKSSGMSMGLSIYRSIIEAHGGRLWATANVPHGATLQFTLPVNADTASRGRP